MPVHGAPQQPFIDNSDIQAIGEAHISNKHPIDEDWFTFEEDIVTNNNGVPMQSQTRTLNA